MVGGAARLGWDSAGKTKLSKIKLVDEHLDDAYRVVLADVVIDTLGQQEGLTPVATFYVACLTS